MSITIEDFKANTKEWFLNKLNNMSITDAVQTIQKLSEKLRKPYPKTYNECCDILGYEPNYDLNNITTHNYAYDYKLQMLYRILICRDAYWKIAGEELGLDKPWDPNSDTTHYRYVLFNYEGRIDADFWFTGINVILAFPTEEMRDIFEENFKALIEQCKELL